MRKFNRNGINSHFLFLDFFPKFSIFGNNLQFPYSFIFGINYIYKNFQFIHRHLLPYFGIRGTTRKIHRHGLILSVKHRRPVNTPISVYTPLIHRPKRTPITTTPVPYADCDQEIHRPKCTPISAIYIPYTECDQEIHQGIVTHSFM